MKLLYKQIGFDNFRLNNNLKMQFIPSFYVVIRNLLNPSKTLHFGHEFDQNTDVQFLQVSNKGSKLTLLEEFMRKSIFIALSLAILFLSYALTYLVQPTKTMI